MFLANLYADECHKLQTELRKNSQKTLLPDAQQELLKMRAEIWKISKEDPPAEKLFNPFRLILINKDLTDIIAFNTLSSILLFIKCSFFKTKNDCDTVIESICECKYQTTSEFDASRVTHQILECFSAFLSPENSKNLSCGALLHILQFCTTEIEHLQGMMSMPLNLLDTVSKFLTFLFEQYENKDFDKVRKEAILSLFYIASTFQSNHSQVAIYAALKSLLTIARVMHKNGSKEQCYESYASMISASCVLVSQQLVLSNSRDSFMLALRIFFNMFQKNCFELLSCFEQCFREILDFILSPQPNIVFRASAFECVADFVSQPSFTQNLFGNTFKEQNDDSLFNKLVNTIISVAKNPSSIPDSQQIALSLISTITNQITSEGEISSLKEQNTEDIEKQLNEFQQFKVDFEEKPKRFIGGDTYDPEKLAKMIFLTPGLSCESIGEFFGNKDQFCVETLIKYLELFDFTYMDFDDSIRLFLISFRIVGEGQIVDRIFECFSNCFFKVHKEVCSSAETLHVLSYAWLMLHTSFYNQNATKDSFEQFSSMLKGQNNGEDFDEDFLKMIYSSISKFSVPIEEEHKINSLAYWELKMQKSKLWRIPLKSEEEIKSITKNYFNCIWPQFSPILISLYIQAQSNFNEVLEPFKEASRIAAMLDATEVQDSIMNTFCPFAAEDATQEKTLVTLQFIVSVVRNYGTSIRKGWRKYVDVLIVLFQLDLLSDEICVQKNICDGNKQIVLSPRMAVRYQRRDSGSILTLLKRIGRSDSDNDILSETKRLKQTINDTNVQELAKQSLTFSHKSLESLISALSETSKAYESNVDQNAIYIAFCIHIASQIASTNSQRIQPLFDQILELFSHCLSIATQTKLGRLLSSLTLNSLFVLIDELWNEESLRSGIINALEMLSKLDQTFLRTNFALIEAGLNLFMQHHSSTFISMYKWMPILQLINIGVDSKIEGGVGHIFHYFVTKASQSSQTPGIERFEDFWEPVLQIAAILCMSENEESYVERFRDFQSLLMFPSLPNIEPSIWKDIFYKLLFPVMSQLTLLAQKKKGPNSQKAMMMAKLLMNSYLFSIQQLLKLSCFESMWYRILKAALDLTKVKDEDIKEAVPEMLSNALRVMKTSGVFESPQRQKMWNVTKQAIESSFPSFISSFLDYED